MNSDYIFTLCRVRDGKVYGDTFTTLAAAREALAAYNAERENVKRRNRNRQLAHSKAYNRAKSAYERSAVLSVKLKRERVPAELMLVGKPIPADA